MSTYIIEITETRKARFFVNAESSQIACDKIQLEYNSGNIHIEKDQYFDSVTVAPFNYSGDFRNGKIPNRVDSRDYPDLYWNCEWFHHDSDKIYFDNDGFIYHVDKYYSSNPKIYSLNEMIDELKKGNIDAILISGHEFENGESEFVYYRPIKYFDETKGSIERNNSLIYWSGVEIKYFIVANIFVHDDNEILLRTMSPDKNNIPVFNQFTLDRNGFVKYDSLESAEIEKRKINVRVTEIHVAYTNAISSGSTSLASKILKDTYHESPFLYELLSCALSPELNAVQLCVIPIVE